MVEQGVDQRPVAIARGRVDDQPGGLVDDQQMLVLEDDAERDVLRLVVRRLGPGTARVKASSPLTLVAGSRTALPSARVSAPALDQHLQPLARQRRHARRQARGRAASRRGSASSAISNKECPPAIDDNMGRRCARFQWRALRALARVAASLAPMNAVDLASLLCSRLCHDLLSPVGALNNGIELLADEQDPEMRERCLELLAESARAIGQQAEILPPGVRRRRRLRRRDRHARGAEPRSKACSAPRSASSSAGWSPATSLPKGAVKLLLNLALIAGDALVRGGRLDVGAERSDDGDRDGDPRRRAARPARPDAARDDRQGRRRRTVEPRAAGAWLAHSLAAEAGGSIQLSDPVADVLLIGVTLPQRSSAQG